MPYVKVYHNPHFLDYRGDHSDIVLMGRPVASVAVTTGLTATEMLATGYARTQHGHAYASWFYDPTVMTHLRSTAVGDMLVLPDGTQHVVEAVGFRLFQPKAVRAVQRLAEAYQRLEEAVGDGSRETLLAAAQKSLLAMQHALVVAGQPQRDTSILWEKAQVGDLVSDSQGHALRVMARRLRPKWRAQQLLAHIPHGQVWIDSPRTWAVLAPAQTEPAMSLSD